ncbi:MAG TPA: hypothetical protein VN455_13320 [Methanotrichaceae archaeon]|nr:hypothetical protein [Methanotrichaceae archaeon]
MSIPARKLLMLCTIIGLYSIFPSSAVDLSYTYSGDGGQSGLTSRYDLYISSGLVEATSIGGGQISAQRSLNGIGQNSLIQAASNYGSTIEGNISSNGSLIASTSALVSSSQSSLQQDVWTTGTSRAGISGVIGPVQSSQESGVLYGSLATRQAVSSQTGFVDSSQEASVAGVLGYAEGEATSKENAAKFTGGSNGVGFLSSAIRASASDTADVSGAVVADSLASKAYSAVEATSGQEQTSSYLSSNHNLISSSKASANGHSSAGQDMSAEGDVLLSAGTSGQSAPVSYTSDRVSGSVYTDQNAVQTDLKGDVKSTSLEATPSAGTSVWGSLGGIITSNPQQILDSQGRDHVFVRGADMGLWDNVGGDWFNLGGIITSDPSVCKDSQGRIHAVAKGADNGVWDNVVHPDTMNSQWEGLGGKIKFDPKVVVASKRSTVEVVAVGEDNILWTNQFNASSGQTLGWSSLHGPTVSSSPSVSADGSDILVRAQNGSLEDYATRTYTYITSA